MKLTTSIVTTRHICWKNIHIIDSPKIHNTLPRHIHKYIWYNAAGGGEKTKQNKKPHLVVMAKRPAQGAPRRRLGAPVPTVPRDGAVGTHHEGSRLRRLLRLHEVPGRGHAAAARPSLHGCVYDGWFVVWLNLDCISSRKRFLSLLSDGKFGCHK